MENRAIKKGIKEHPNSHLRERNASKGGSAQWYIIRLTFSEL